MQWQVKMKRKNEDWIFCRNIHRRIVCVCFVSLYLSSSLLAMLKYLICTLRIKFSWICIDKSPSPPVKRFLIRKDWQRENLCIAWSGKSTTRTPCTFVPNKCIHQTMFTPHFSIADTFTPLYLEKNCLLLVSLFWICTANCFAFHFIHTFYK